MIRRALQLIFYINKMKEGNNTKQYQAGNPEAIEKDMTVFIMRI